MLKEAGYANRLTGAWTISRCGCTLLLANPYPQEANDITSIVVRKDGADQFAAIVVDTFDEMLEQSARQSVVMGIALHPYIVGHPHRLRLLRGVLAHIAAQRDRIWFTTEGPILDATRAPLPRAIPGTPRRPRGKRAA